MNSGFTHKHLLSIAELSRDDLLTILQLADRFWEINQRTLKKVPTLRGRTVINLFFENSTRTRTSFEIAAKRLSADAVNISGSGSSASKGETTVDTARNLQAMHPDVIVVRHSSSGAPALIAKHVDCAVVNAGDGTHEHPTQALLDCATLRKHKAPDGDFSKLKVVIVGDIDHSRVARSNLYALTKLGAKVTLCGPHTLIPPRIREILPAEFAEQVSVAHNLETAVTDADAIMMLRIQNERTQGEAPRFANTREYARTFGLGERHVARAKPGVVVLHPGPINRGVELPPSVADGAQSLILEQVSHGVAVRMAVLYLLGGGGMEET